MKIKDDSEGETKISVKSCLKKKKSDSPDSSYRTSLEYSSNAASTEECSIYLSKKYMTNNMNKDERKNEQFLRSLSNPMIETQIENEMEDIFNKSVKMKNKDEIIWRNNISLMKSSKNENVSRRVRFSLPGLPGNCQGNSGNSSTTEEDSATTPTSEDSDDNESYPEHSRRKSSFIRRNLNRFTPQTMKIDECDELGLINSKKNRKIKLPFKNVQWGLLSFKLDNHSRIRDEKNC